MQLTPIACKPWANAEQDGAKSLSSAIRRISRAVATNNGLLSSSIVGISITPANKCSSPMFLGISLPSAIIGNLSPCGVLAHGQPSVYSSEFPEPVGGLGLAFGLWLLEAGRAAFQLPLPEH
jgi:hypothetical protein